MGKTLKRKDIYAHDYGTHSDSGEAYFSKPEKSKMDKILKDIDFYLKTNNYSKLYSILKQDFVLEVLDDVYENRYDSPFGGTEITKYMFYEAQPVIEVLFYQHREQLITMLDYVIKNGKSTERCAENIIRSISESDLDVFRLWDESVSKRIFDHLDELQKYGQKLAAKKINKGPVAIDLVDSLRKNLIQIDLKSSPLEIVCEKIKFVTKLHSQDKIFNKHRIYSKVVAINATLGVLGGGVLYGAAGLVHKSRTGRFGFFNQTKTEENIENIHLELDPTRKLLTG